MTQLVNKASSWRTLRRKVVVGASSLALVAGMGVALAPAANAADPTPPKVTVKFADQQVSNAPGSVASFTVTIDNSAATSEAQSGLSGVLTVTLPAGVQCGAVTAPPGTDSLGKLGVPADAAPFTQPTKGVTTADGNVCSFNVGVADLAQGAAAASAAYTLTSVGVNPTGPAFTGAIKAEFKLTTAPGGQYKTAWTASGSTQLVTPYAAQFAANVPAPVSGKKYNFKIVTSPGLPAAQYKVFRAEAQNTNPVTYNITAISPSGTVYTLGDFAFDSSTGRITSDGVVTVNPTSPTYTIVANGTGAPAYNGATGVLSPVPALTTAGDFMSPQFSLATLFSDYSTTSAFGEEVYALAAEGVIEGYDDGTFGPEKPISRGAFAAYIARTVNLMEGAGTADTGVCRAGDNAFPDVANNLPFCMEINWIYGNDITTGYADGGFHPGASITRQAIAAMLHRLDTERGYALPTNVGDAEFNDIEGNPFADDIEWLASTGIATGYADGGFHPAGTTTRQAGAAFFYRFADAQGYTW